MVQFAPLGFTRILYLSFRLSLSQPGVDSEVSCEAPVLLAIMSDTQFLNCRNYGLLVPYPGYGGCIHLHSNELFPQKLGLHGVESTRVTKEHDHHHASILIQMGLCLIQQLDGRNIHSSVVFIGKLQWV